MNTRLSLLVCTIPSRESYLRRLMAVLEPQLRHGVELLVGNDDAGVSIGAKRNALLAASAGDYVAFIDDDDLVSPDYTRLMLEGCGSERDCVGLKVRRFSDGREIGEAIHSIQFDAYGQFDLPGWIEFRRTPNHLNPIRRELALQAGFPPLDWAEDKAYAERVRPLLKTEYFVDQAVYDYLYRSPYERRGEVTHESRIPTA